MTLAISNARIVLADGVVSGGIIIEDGVIKAITSELWPQADECYDAEGRYVSPGFIDLHVHGGGGYDFMDGTAQSMLGAAREHMRHGTTLLLPTTVGQMLNGGKCTVKVLTSPDNWYGVTYADDKPVVVAALKAMADEGKYPDGLWK